MRSLITLSLIAGSLVLSSCGDNKKEQEETATESHQDMKDHSGHAGHSSDMNSDEDAAMATADFSDEAVKQAFAQYLKLKDALVQSNAETAAESAQNLQSVLKEKNTEIAALAGKITAEKDLNVQRELFSELTAAMDSVLKEAISSGKIYKQYCPMAFEGKGDYWYSDSDQIRNPYYGDKMLKCGRVEETIM